MSNPTPEVPETPEPPKAASAGGFVYCDHRCLKDDGHVERGELHFYGYVLPRFVEASEYDRVCADRDALLAAEDEQPATPEVVERARRWQDCYERGVNYEGEPCLRDDLVWIGAELVADLLALVDRPAAPVDEHPPTFHVRRTSVGGGVWKHDEWFWTCVEANGKKIATQGETIEDREWVIGMAHRFAAPLGAKVVVEET